jgi:hypothetical protein
MIQARGSFQDDPGKRILSRIDPGKRILSRIDTGKRILSRIDTGKDKTRTAC